MQHEKHQLLLQPDQHFKTNWHLINLRLSNHPESVGFERASKQFKSERKNFNSNSRLVQDKSYVLYIPLKGRQKFVLSVKI